MKISIRRSKNLILFIGLVLILLSGCSDSANEIISAPRSEKNATTTKPMVSSIDYKKFPERKFIRTAELRFKVENVVESTYKIEDLVNRSGGFVTASDLKNQIENVTTVAVSADSSLETTTYSVFNTMTLRVPNNNLDLTLKEIGTNIKQLDHRTIKAEDVALQMLSHSFTKQRSANTANRIEVKPQGDKKIKETVLAEEILSAKELEADQASLQNLSLNDQVDFSTVQLSFYERPVIKKEVIVINRTVEPYEPPFGRKLLTELSFGWQLIEALILFIAKFWALLFAASLIYFITKRYGARVSKAGSSLS